MNTNHGKSGSDAMNKISEVVENPYKYLIELKKSTGKKVIGIFPQSIPEEMFHAAGVLPVTLWRKEEPVTRGNAHVSTWNCALVRSVADDLAKGALSFFDGMAVGPTCLQARAMYYIIQRNISLPYLEFVNWPVFIKTPLAREYLLHNLKRLKLSLEKFTGNVITDESLESSIRVYNENRALLEKLYQLRKNRPGSIRAGEMMAIVQSSMLMQKEEHNQLLREIIPYLESRESDVGEKKKIVLMGGLCQTIQKEVLNLLEDSGAVIVDDDLFVGSWYVASNVDIDGNLLDALADRYLRRSPITLTKSDWEADWAGYIIDKVRENKAHGVVSFLIKNCPPHMMWVRDVHQNLVEAKIPELLLEIEQEIPSIEQLRTRVGAFMEVLQGGRQ